MKVFVCIVAALCFQMGMAIVCLPNACDNVDCGSAMQELMSCEGRIDAKGGFCGCCPACIKQLNEGESCATHQLGAPAKVECGAGLECHPGTKTCVKLETLVKGPCHAEVLQASNNLQSGMVGVHLPECLEDGSYAPVQCREATCTCVDKKGNQLYGIEASVSRHQEMNCQCARDKDARKLSMIVFEHKCDELGNYERMQCSRGVCYCVNHMGQKIESLGQRPEEQKEELGGCLVRFHRRQAVEQGACARELALLQLQPPRPGQHKPQCLEDGSYHPRQCREAVCTCVDSAGKSTGHIANVGMASQMTCNCARDQADYMSTGMVGKSYNCDKLGNYEKFQCVGSVCFCVDENGQQLTALPSVSIGQLSSLKCLHSEKRQAVEQGACARELELLQSQAPLLGARKPACLEDGSYHPRQCFGSQCTCVDSAGQSTEYSAHISQSSQMECDCARDKADYMKTGLIGKMFYCDELGNYKSKQVEGPLGACARELEQLQQGPKLLGQHKPQCAEDGSYEARQCHEGFCHCVDTEGKHIGHINHVSQAANMNCNCARDKAEYMKTGMVGKMFNCDMTGNYEKIQCTGSVCHCVDETGNKLMSKPSVSIGNISQLQC